MKIKDLIVELQKYDPETLVLHAGGCDGSYLEEAPMVESLRVIKRKDPSRENWSLGEYKSVEDYMHDLEYVQFSLEKSDDIYKTLREHTLKELEALEATPIDAVFI